MDSINFDRLTENLSTMATLRYSTVSRPSSLSCRDVEDAVQHLVTAVDHLIEYVTRPTMDLMVTNSVNDVYQQKNFFKNLKKKNENGHIGNFKCFLRWPLASFFFLLPFGASVAFYLLHRWDFCSKSGGGNSCVVGPTDTPSVKHGSMDPFNGTPSRR